ncbi:MAG: CHAT domain-containing protein [Candidatus Eisenbacteria bacterium]|nr:CHAT domain-containing protein [Candidatus Latescibacterota bacterium]MBD3301857.1 CHAT domain-containing protein [Candidatus Eisenbacteria bacterium]
MGSRPARCRSRSRSERNGFACRPSRSRRKRTRPRIGGRTGRVDLVDWARRSHRRPVIESDPNQIDALLSSDEIDPLLEAIGSLDFVPGPKTAARIRDRAARELLNDPSTSLRIARALLAAAARHHVGDPETRAWSWRAYAEACLYLGRMRTAGRAYERATREAEAANDDRLLGQILVGRIGTLTLMGRDEGIEPLVRRADRLLRSADDLAYLGKLHMNLGSAHYHGERYAKAYEEYETAASVLETATGIDSTWIGLRLNQGIACTHLFRIQQARALFLEVEGHADRLGQERLGAQARYNRALLEAVAGDYRAALLLLDEAEPIFARQEARDLQAGCLLARAETFLDLGMPVEAQEPAREAAETFARETMDLDATLARIAEARSLLQMDRTDAAIDRLRGAERFYRGKRIGPGRAHVLLLLAEARLARGEFSAARTAAREAGRLFGAANMELGEVQARTMLARAQLATGRPGAAARTLGPALRTLPRMPMRVRMELLALSGRVARAAGRRAESLRRLRRAIRALEDQRRLIPGLELRSRAFERQVEVYHDLIGILIDSPRVRTAPLFRTIESARGRGFRERRVVAGVARSEDLEEKRALLGALVREAERMEAAPERGDDPEERTKVRGRVVGLEREITRLARSLERREEDGRSWEGGIDPGGIAPLLDEDEAVIAYFVTGGRVLALVVRREGAVFRPLEAEAARIEERVAELRSQVDFMAATSGRPIGNLSFQRRAAEEELRALYEQLVAPLLDHLPESGRLTLVPHSILHLVPFECLHDGTGYVDERFRISRTPTADFLLTREEAFRGSARPWLVAGTVHEAPPSVGTEIDAVSACLPADRRRVLRDPSAGAILEAIAGAGSIHWSGHGAFREDNPAFSYLILHDGALFLADILERRTRADLVVLSACNTGRVFTGRGDDLSGVAHAFLAAGARRLVASHWRVHDAATEEWMRHFYRTLGASRERDPVAAVNQAGRETRKRWDHPFYWGGFGVHGG